MGSHFQPASDYLIMSGLLLCDQIQVDKLVSNTDRQRGKCPLPGRNGDRVGLTDLQPAEPVDPESI